MAKRGSYLGGSTIIRVHLYPGRERAIGALEIAAKEYDFTKTSEAVLVKKEDMTREETAERRRNQKVSSQTRRAKNAKKLAKQLASLPARQEKRARREEQRRLEKARQAELRCENARALEAEGERRPTDPELQAQRAETRRAEDELMSQVILEVKRKRRRVPHQGESASGSQRERQKPCT